MPYSVETLKAVFKSEVVRDGFPCCCYHASDEFLRLFGQKGDKLIGGIYASDGPDYAVSVCENFTSIEDCMECGGDPDFCALNRHYWVEREGEIIDLTAYQFTDTFGKGFRGTGYKNEIAAFLKICNSEELPGVYIPLFEDKKI